MIICISGTKTSSSINNPVATFLERSQLPMGQKLGTQSRIDWIPQKYERLHLHLHSLHGWKHCLCVWKRTRNKSELFMRLAKKTLISRYMFAHMCICGTFAFVHTYVHIVCVKEHKTYEIWKHKTLSISYFLSNKNSKHIMLYETSVYCI